MSKSTTTSPEDTANTSGDEPTDADLWMEMDADGDTPDDDDDRDPADTPDDDPDLETGGDGGDGGDNGSGKSDDLDPIALAEQNERLMASFRSEQSRSIGQQRRAERLQKRVEELEAKIAASADQGSDDDDEITRLKEDYPDVAGPILKKMEQISKDRADPSQERDAAKEELGDIEAAELEKFNAEHTDGFKVVSEDPQKFRRWLDDQPREMRDIFERNRTHLVDGTGAALLVSRYKAALLEPQSETVVDENRRSNAGTLTAKREKQLSGAATQRASARTTRVVQDDPTGSDDPQAEWDYWDRKDRQKKA